MASYLIVEPLEAYPTEPPAQLLQLLFDKIERLKMGSTELSPVNARATKYLHCLLQVSEGDQGVPYEVQRYYRGIRRDIR